MSYATYTKEAIKKKTGPKRKPFIERFWSHVDKRGEDECWMWIGGGTRHETSYGSIEDDNYKRINGHRASFIIHYRELEEGEWVLHSCTNLRCVNPCHLYVGDRNDWARKWHSVEVTQDYLEDRKEKARKRSSAYYKVNRNKVRLYSSDLQLKQKLEAVMLLGGKCMKCAEDHPAALQFHHRDPKTKKFNLATQTLSSTKKYTVEEIREEIEKCDLLCSNCHAKHHSNWQKSGDSWIVVLQD